MIKKLLPVLIITLLVLVLLGIKIYPKVYPLIGDNTMDSQPEKQSKENVKSNNKQHRDMFLAPTFPFERKEYEELAKKYPDKFAIVEKMYYSWDYIDNAQGEYEWSNLGGETFKGWFSIDFIKKKSRSKQERLENGKVIETQNFLFNNAKEIRKLPNKKIYTKVSYKDIPNSNPDLFETDSLGMTNRTVTNSEWYTLLYNNYSNWNYNLEEKYGMPTYEIKGNIPNNISEGLEGPFTMTVSKETGALLDLQCFGKENKVIYFVKTKNIKINKGISDDLFQLDLSGDKELAFKDYTLQTVGANAIKGDKKGWDK